METGEPLPTFNLDTVCGTIFVKVSSDLNGYYYRQYMATALILIEIYTFRTHSANSCVSGPYAWVYESYIQIIPAHHEMRFVCNPIYLVLMALNKAFRSVGTEANDLICALIHAASVASFINIRNHCTACTKSLECYSSQTNFNFAPTYACTLSACSHERTLLNSSFTLQIHY